MGGVKVGDGGIEASTICVGAVCANERERGPTVCRARLGIKTKGASPTGGNSDSVGRGIRRYRSTPGYQGQQRKAEERQKCGRKLTEDKSILLRPRWN